MGRTSGVVLTLALLVAACGDDGGGDSGGGDLTFDDLADRTFVSTTVEGQELVDGSEIRLTFTDGRVSAQAGCNTQTGEADVVDGTLEVGDLAGTLMGCEEDLEAQDRWLGELLESGPDITLDGEALTLSSGDVTLELTEEA